MKKGDKKKTNKSYQAENPGKIGKRWKASDVGPKDSPYHKSKGKKMSKMSKPKAMY